MMRPAWKWLASAALLAATCSPSDASGRLDGAEPAEAQLKEDRDSASSEEEAAAEFVVGNVLFVTFHEFGHALITEFKLPVLGREEDAVDNFASMLLVPEGDDPEMDASFLVNAMAGWFVSGAMSAPEDIAWWAEHGPDQQRAYQIACVLYGSKVGAYDELAEEIGLPQERREGCEAEYKAVSSGWATLLEPHLLGDGEKPSARITVSYGDASEYAAEKALLKESELMETVAAELASSFRLKRQLRMKGAKCGEPNAFWNPEAGEVTICYELLRDYQEMYARLSK